MTDPRKIKRLIDWLVKQRAQHLDMVTDAGDASLWCKEEADLISEHIRTVEALATRPKAHEVTPRPAWDDETCLRFAEAYDREDAAQRGEPSPHADKGEGYAEWVADRIACARAGLAALTPAPQPEGQVMDGWVDDKTFIEPVSPAATPTAQEAVPTEDELDEAWKSGFNAGFGEAMIAAHPPQPSETVAEITDLNHPAIDAFWDAHRNTVTTRDMNGWRRAVRNGLNAALRALKGGA